jgi:hypothetical protein
MPAVKKRRFTINPEKFFYIYDTRGDWHGTVLQGAIWDGRGEYIGFILDEIDNNEEKYAVYTAGGEWIGHLIQDGRIIRKRTYNRRPLLSMNERPAKPPKPQLPPKAPLAPLPGDIGFSLLDVLDWEPETFKQLSDLRPDLE